MNAKVRKQIKQRSGGQCEVFNEGFLGLVRCEKKATQIHHMLTKARGGEHLDDHTNYHLIHLCTEHHAMADGKEAYDSGMLIHGEVRWDKLLGKPIYTGPDRYLTKWFGE